MALIKCPECGKKISEMAKACPKCGRLIKYKNSWVAFLIGLLFPGLGQFYNGEWGKGIGIIILAPILYWIFYYFQPYRPYKHASALLGFVIVLFSGAWDAHLTAKKLSGEKIGLLGRCFLRVSEKEFNKETKGNFIRKILGFRSGKKWKMIIALIGYWIIIVFLASLISYIFI